MYDFYTPVNVLRSNGTLRRLTQRQPRFHLLENNLDQSTAKAYTNHMDNTPTKQRKSRKQTKPAKTTEQEHICIIDIICEEIANSDRGLWRICGESKELPNPRTVSKWIAENTEFAQKYARAKESQADFMADQIIELADKCRLGKKTTVKANGDVETSTGDMVERSRLQLEARKWLAGKLRPKKYGDRIEIEHDVSDTLAASIKIARERANLISCNGPVIEG